MLSSTESQRTSVRTQTTVHLALYYLTWADDPFIPSGCRWYSTLHLVLAVLCYFPGLAECSKILTFISVDTRSMSDPHAQVPASTICPSSAFTSKHNASTHQMHNYMDTDSGNERHILTSRCSTLDRQTGRHMQRERGQSGQGARFGEEPRSERCGFNKKLGHWNFQGDTSKKTQKKPFKRTTCKNTYSVSALTYD